MPKVAHEQIAIWIWACFIQNRSHSVKNCTFQANWSSILSTPLIWFFLKKRRLSFWGKLPGMANDFMVLKNGLLLSSFMPSNDL
jgi:hypothetical protein